MVKIQNQKKIRVIGVICGFPPPLHEFDCGFRVEISVISVISGFHIPFARACARRVMREPS
jgi:hypothetical protein